ncbi:uncharacterized protein LOC114840356 isoform X3 [Esox lucius]|uniref:uncharacterized protein LOC114840356 isoform X3 n=1 Tax=Esox lucius TaxID=8010 RepID=UPI001476B376|nr:uncharacterized protein LOC114840356 isoform X3 [Esox lucius]
MLLCFLLEDLNLYLAYNLYICIFWQNNREPLESLSRKRQATDHLYSLPACPKAIKAKLEKASARVRKLQREKSNSLRREKRAKMNMQALLEELKEKNLINEELKDNLECYLDLLVHLLSRQGIEYTKAQRDFALTLHLHGPKAYQYLRETLHIHLPHPSSLQRWLSSLDARPGLNKMMLDMLERRRQEDEVKSLTPQSQTALVEHALEELHRRQIRVVCMTMDGHASNVSMCTQLGCNLKADPCEPLKTHFPHPVTREDVFVMMDACHMLKLTRNMLQAYSPIRSITGSINWKYIVHLNNVQKKSGLHAANRVTDKHVNFANQKMKVSLADQTLSSSVAVALRTLQELGYAEFKDCEATSEFIKITDILNSRNPRAKGFKTPLGFRNWTSTREFLSKARGYLLTLKMEDGKPLYRTKRFLSVLGFIINIDTLMSMVPVLLERQ